MCDAPQSSRSILSVLLMAVLAFGLLNPKPVTADPRRKNWSKQETRAELAQTLTANLDIQSPDDWYQIVGKDFKAAGGIGFFNIHGGSPRAAVKALSAEGLIDAPLGGWKDAEFGSISKWDDKETLQKLVTNVEKALRIKSPEDWYRVTRNDFTKAKGKGFVDGVHGGSAKEAIKSLTEKGLIAPPEGGWNELRFRGRNKWDDLANLTKVVRALESTHNLKSPEDWYQVTATDFRDVGGMGLIRRNGSLVATVKALTEKEIIKAPAGGWEDELFERQTGRKHERSSEDSEGLKTSKPNRGKRSEVSSEDLGEIVKAIMSALEIRKPEDWYYVTEADFIKYGGAEFLKLHKNKRSRAIEALSSQGFIKAPDGGWKKGRFRPKTKWEDETNLKNLVKTLETNLKLSSPDDWYEVTSQDFTDAARSGFLQRYEGSPRKAILHLSELGLIEVPTGGWDESKFGGATTTKVPVDLKTLVKVLKTNHTFTSPEDWYRVTATNIRKAGGSDLLATHDGSPRLVIRALDEAGLIKAPDGGWDETKFNGGSKWEDPTTLKELVTNLERNLNINTPEDWYRVRKSDFAKAGGGGFLTSHHKGSPKAAIQDLSEQGLIQAPKEGWDESEFGALTKWDHASNLESLVKTLQINAGIESPEGWYQVGVEDFTNAGAKGFLSRRHGNSPKSAIQSLSKLGFIPAPKGGWDEAKFGAPRKWDDKTNLQNLVKALEKRINLQSPEDWTRVTHTIFEEAGGSGFLVRHKGSIKAALVSLSEGGFIRAPGEGWDSLEFRGSKQETKQQERRQATYLAELTKRLESNLGLVSPEDWYSVTGNDFRAAGGSRFLDENGRSPKAAIQQLSELGFIKAPPLGWDSNRFGPVFKWDDETAVRQMVETLQTTYQLKTPEDWYHLRGHDFEAVGLGGYLSSRHRFSPKSAVLELSQKGYIAAPPGGWDESKFGSLTKWEEESNLRALVQTLETNLKIRSPEDWYRVTSKDFDCAGYLGYLSSRHKNSPKRAIQELSRMGFIEAPKGGWQDKEFAKNKKSQKLLHAHLRDILGDAGLFDDRRSHGVKNPKTGRPLEADISYPDLKLAIEFQGLQHEDEPEVQERDETKRQEFPKKGWLLIEIRETNWDRTEESVLKALEEKLPQHPEPTIRDEIGKRIRTRRCGDAVQLLAS